VNDVPVAVPSPVIEPALPADPPAPVRRFEELTVKEDSVIGIRLDTPLSSETARVEDKVTARVTRDVSVDGHVAIASGVRLEGTVTSVDRGGRFKERARLGLRFHSIVLADNTRVPIKTETIFREGQAPTGEAAGKIGGGAVLGMILGAAVGGKKGAAIGGAAGAAGGAGAVMAGGTNDATLASGTPLTVRLTAPVTLIVERDQELRR
jgi:hypothetical protein